MFPFRFISIFFISIILTFFSSPVNAFEYPVPEIEFIVGYAPGSNTDNFGRLASKYGEMYIGKPIIVINKPPAAIGFSALASAKPDGYTIGIISNSTIGQQYLLKVVKFHYRKSYKVICRIDYSAEGLYVKKEVLLIYL